ncbi:TraK family protein [Desulfobacter sp. UBA2225]|uniref:TraK family protein n=1 Tax=Desulfobacter sp. UBA2225 TaxID=1961413 RepID=UPI00258091BF|nr:TraK family protein [Desulfobacter sp. UBA2225]
MNLKPTCKSQYLAVHNEARQLLDQGYTKKSVFDYFVAQKKITISYKAWVKIVDNYDQKSPFSRKKKAPPARTSIGQSSGSKKGKFSHSNDPYPTEDATDSIVEEKENEKPFNLIKKGK